MNFGGDNQDQDFDSQLCGEMQNSIQLNDMNILGLKGFYEGSSQRLEKDTISDNQSQKMIAMNQKYTMKNTSLDQLGQQLNEVIGQYLSELTSQTRQSLDSFSLQNSENLDEEQQQQILDWELNAIRQRIYKNVVDKLNLSVIQSVCSIQSSSQLNSVFNSREIINSTAQISLNSQRSQVKSLAHSIIDLQQQTQMANNAQKKLEEQYTLLLQEIDENITFEELNSKFRLSLQIIKEYQAINKQLNNELQKNEVIFNCIQIQTNNQYAEYFPDEVIVKEKDDTKRLKYENANLKEQIQSMRCSKCKEFLRNN